MSHTYEHRVGTWAPWGCWWGGVGGGGGEGGGGGSVLLNCGGLLRNLPVPEPLSHILLQITPVTLQRDILLQGRLYLSEKLDLLLQQHLPLGNSGKDGASLVVPVASIAGVHGFDPWSQGTKLPLAARPKTKLRKK